MNTVQIITKDIRDTIRCRPLYQDGLSGRWCLLGFSFFLLLAIALRLYRLDGPGLWFDELFTFRLASSRTLTEMLDAISWEKSNPRLHYVAMWGLFKTFGTSVWVGRGLSVLAGVLGVTAMYFLGRRMFNRETGLYAMALSTMCYHHLAVSQDARPYALAFLFSVLSFLFFIAVLQELKRRYLAGYIFFSALLLHTHHYGLLVLASQFLLFLLYCAINRHRLERRLFLYAALAMLALLLSLLPMYSILVGAASLRPHSVSNYSLGGQPASLFYIAASYIHYFGSSLPLVTVVSLAIIFGVLVTFFRRQEPVRQSQFMVTCLLIWIAVVVCISYLYASLVLPVMHYRYFTVCLPPLLLLTAWGLYLVGAKYALVALLIQASAITENIIFTKRQGAFSPERMHAAYQISYPRDRRHRKQILQRLASYDTPVYIADVGGGDLPFYEKIFEFPSGIIKGQEELQQHLQGRPKEFWMTAIAESTVKHPRKELRDIERKYGLLQKGYQRGQELHYKRIMARQYLPVYTDLPVAEE